MVLNSYYSVQKCDFYTSQNCRAQKEDNILDFIYMHKTHTVLSFCHADTFSLMRTTVYPMLMTCTDFGSTAKSGLLFVHPQKQIVLYTGHYTGDIVFIKIS